ncbi:unnamed protein product [Linum tenue]|uniref:Pectinesterase inhibitor domain-containing protein n=1 Tax=Linum tenue TaxID=586396 RepID=A0AAV0HJG0_9ROSI|nr:unnamed protein product [Linum tenue]
MQYFKNSTSIFIVILLHSTINIEAARTSPSSTKPFISYSSSPLISKLNKTALKPPPSTINPSIRSLCLATKNTKKCMELILPFAAAGGATDPVSILNVEIQSLYDMTGQAISTAMRLSKEDRAVTSLEADREVLKSCVKTYGVAAKELVKAGLALSTRDSKTVILMLRATVSSFRRCDKAFEMPGRLNKGVMMKEIDQVLLDMAKLCLEISMLIQKGAL